MNHVFAFRKVVVAALVCVCVVIGVSAPPSSEAIDAVGTYTLPAFCVGSDLHIGPTVPFVDQSRANGNGPNLPSAWTGPLLDIVVPGPGTWSNLIIELPAGEGAAAPARFLFVSPTTITCPPVGCENLAMTDTAVVGAFVADGPLYYAPGQPVEPAMSIPAGNTAWVLGVDSTGQYYKITWVCNYLWVPVGTMGPNYDAVWQGKPLPVDVVE